MIAIFISVLFTAWFLTYVYKNYGIRSSISASYYVLKYKWMFLLWTWGTALPLIFIADSGWSFFAGCFLMFVGVASNTRVTDKVVGIVHVVGATGAIVLGYIYLCLSLHLWILAGVSLIPLIYLWIKKPKNHTWWIEILALTTFIIGLTIKILK